MKIERRPSSSLLSTMANCSPFISFDSQWGPNMRYDAYASKKNHHIYYTIPVFLRSSGVLRACRVPMKMAVDIKAVSTSLVTTKAMMKRERARNHA